MALVLGEAKLQEIRQAKGDDGGMAEIVGLLQTGKASVEDLQRFNAICKDAAVLMIGGEFAVEPGPSGVAKVTGPGLPVQGINNLFAPQWLVITQPENAAKIHTLIKAGLSGDGMTNVAYYPPETGQRKGRFGTIPAAPSKLVRLSRGKQDNPVVLTGDAADTKAKELKIFVEPSK